MRSGRPRKPVKQKKTKEIVQKMAELGTSNSEIAQFIEVDDSTLKRNYEKYLTKGRGVLKNKLRKKQIDIALNGNVTMLIWLGKQYLGQSESTQNEIDDKEIIVTVRVRK